MNALERSRESLRRVDTLAIGVLLGISGIASLASAKTATEIVLGAALLGAGVWIGKSKPIKSPINQA